MIESQKSRIEYTHYRDNLQITKRQSEILKNFKSYNEGINTKRINSWLIKNAINKSKLLFLPTSEIPRLNGNLKSLGITELSADNNNPGKYIPLLDLSIIIRKAKEEEDNGIIVSEGFAIHEAYHASTDKIIKLTKSGKEIFKRHGFVLISENKEEDDTYDLLEEAAAEYFRGKYITEFFEDIKNPFLKDPNIVFSCSAGNQSLYIANRYLFKGEHGYVCKPGSPSAYALELLIQKDPKLESLLIDAHSNPKKLGQLFRCLEGLGVKVSDFRHLNSYVNSDAAIFQKIVQEAIK